MKKLMMFAAVVIVAGGAFAGSTTTIPLCVYDFSAYVHTAVVKESAMPKKKADAPLSRTGFSLKGYVVIANELIPDDVDPLIVDTNQITMVWVYSPKEVNEGGPVYKTYGRTDGSLFGKSIDNAQGELLMEQNNPLGRQFDFYCMGFGDAKGGRISSLSGGLIGYVEEDRGFLAAALDFPVPRNDQQKAYGTWAMRYNKKLSAAADMTAAIEAKLPQDAEILESDLFD